MENNNNKKKNVIGHGTSSSSLDHLFGPRDSSSFSSNSGMFSSIFPPPSTVLARDQKRIQDLGCGKYNKPENFSQGRKGESSTGITNKDSIYQTETADQCTFSSSIHYGGQENYSLTTRTTHESPHYIKKDENDDDPNGKNPNGASRGNWWQGSLYY